jgi:site-specific recombinase XerD
VVVSGEVLRAQPQAPTPMTTMRWMQEVRRLKPSTVSRRLSVLSCFYRTCAIDDIFDHSPAEYVRRPHVPPESPTLGLSHLQFEAMLTAGRDSTNINDFALVAMRGLLGLRVFEATGSDIEALGELRGHRVLRVHGKGDKSRWCPCRRQSVALSTARRQPRARSSAAWPHRPHGPPRSDPPPTGPCSGRRGCH